MLYNMIMDVMADVSNDSLIYILHREHLLLCVVNLCDDGKVWQLEERVGKKRSAAKC